MSLHSGRRSAATLGDINNMSPTLVGCVICGELIGDGQGRWQDETRAGEFYLVLDLSVLLLADSISIVVTRGYAWSEVYLSGIGLHTDLSEGSMPAPSDFRRRYDDPDYTPTQLDQIYPMQPLYNEPDEPPFVPAEEVDREEPQFARLPWGFPCHASCWSILERTFPSETGVPLQTFNDFCRSMPVECDLLNWGHDYGGMRPFGIKPNELPPGEDVTQSGLELTRWLLADGRPLPPRHRDPFHIPALKQALTDSINGTLLDRPLPVQQTRVWSGQASPGDPFAKIPAEILDSVLPLLPSKDLCNLRSSSRTVMAWPLSQRFWASRFHWGYEFEFIFEARDYLNGRQIWNWRALYFHFASLKTLPALVNRRRIWTLIRPLSNLLTTYDSLSAAGLPVRNYFEKDAVEDDRTWQRASGALQSQPGFEDYSACLSLFERVIKVGPVVSRVYISFVNFSGEEYVTGLRLETQGQPDECLGYIHSNNEVLLMLDDPLDGLYGFELRIGPRGIQALAILNRSGESTTFAGRPESGPRRRLHSSSGPILSLNGIFDVGFNPSC